MPAKKAEYSNRHSLTASNRNTTQKQHETPCVKLVAIAKNEGPYIPRWVYHHLHTGIALIEIHINDTTDNSLKICNNIARQDKRFKFIQGDRLLRKCKKDGENYQTSAYRKSLMNSLRGRDSATHILYLDLDEYLTSRTGNNNINTLIDSRPEADVFSFLWYLEYWNGNRKPFTDPLSNNSAVIRNQHVKSLIKVSRNIRSCKTHNVQFKKNYSPLNLLSDTGINLVNKENAHHKRQLISSQLMTKLSAEEPEGWFIYHAVYRSETEYLASLIQGTGHTAKQCPIKNNRWGLRNPRGSVLRLEKTSERMRDRLNYFIFLSKHQLHRELREAKQHLIKRRKKLDRLLKKQPNIINEYPQAFQGTTYEDRIQYISQQQKRAGKARKAH